MSFPLLAGVYEHYKGHPYLVLGRARDANDESRVVVVYIGLDLQGARSPERMSVRTESDFRAVVDPRTGEPGPGAVGARPRFVYLGSGVPGLPGPR